jgi:hypothetical protein
MIDLATRIAFSPALSGCSIDMAIGFLVYASYGDVAWLAARYSTRSCLRLVDVEV